MITKKNILNHEFIGQNVKIKSQKGIIIDETKNTFIILTKKNEKIIPKEKNMFEFEINNEKIKINGNKITQRPFDRLKKKYKVKNKWQKISE